MTVGCNQRFTPQKWDRIKYLIRVHSAMVRGITTRESWALSGYNYFDLYAGPGFYKDEICGSLFGSEGSPLIAAAMLRSQRHKLFFNDAEPSCIAQLTTTLAATSVQAQVSCMDVRDFAGLVCTDIWRAAQFGCLDCKAMGLVFADPNGSPDWDALEALTRCRQYDRLDVLVNVNATSIKRCRQSPLHRHKYHPLADDLARLRKRYLYVWTPHKSNAWQFALIFATNWKDFPQFEHSKFWRVDSPDGHEVFDRLNRTEKERAA